MIQRWIYSLIANLLILIFVAGTSVFFLTVATVLNRVKQRLARVAV
jgi:hypothetical protein